MRTFHMGAALFALAALSSCNEIKSLNGTLSLSEANPVVMNDAGGGPVELQAGPTEITLEKGVLTVHNNLTTLTLNVDKKLVKDLSSFTIPGSVTGQPVTISGSRATVDVDQNATPTVESCYVHDYFGQRPDRRCESGRANVWRCAWGTRPVTHFSSTKTDEFTIRFTRDSDGHDVGTVKARLSFHRNEGSSGGRCFVDFGRNWDICDYRCIAPPRPVVVRPPVNNPGRPGGAGGHAVPRQPRDRDPRHGGHPGRPLPPPPGETVAPPPPIK